MRLAGSHERQANTPAAMLEANSQPIHVPPPAIPRSNQRAQNRNIGMIGISDRDEQAPRHL